MGEAMNYWDFFPAEEGWAHMPVWGFADVVASKADGVPEGTRIFGYLPPASHLVVQPDRSDPADFVDTTPYRAKLPAAYNRYIRVAGLPFYEEKNEDQQMLLWPLYFTSFLIDDFLDDEVMFGAKTAVLSSASSRTSSALAWLLARRDGIEVIGLTSPGNVEFTESLGVYDKVVPYEEIDSLEAKPAVYVDMSGDAKVRSAVHGHYGDELSTRPLSASLIARISEAPMSSPARSLSSSSPPTASASAPRTGAPTASTSGSPRAGRRYVEWTRDWLRVEHGSGPEDVERIYRELLDGKSDPAVGHVLSP